MRKGKKKKGGRYTPPKATPRPQPESPEGHHGQHGEDCYGCKLASLSFIGRRRRISTSAEVASDRADTVPERSGVQGHNVNLVGFKTGVLMQGGTLSLTDSGFYTVTAPIVQQGGTLRTRNTKAVRRQPSESDPGSGSSSVD